MSQILTPSLTVNENTRLRKIRELNVAGTITVKEGDIVKSSSIVGKASLPGELMILRIPEAMGIESTEAVSGLNVKQGESVQVGQILCEHAGLFGLFKSRYKSPYSGTIELVNEKTGHIGLRLEPRTISLSAYMSGQIVSLTPGKSVTIEASATYIQGIFGVGGERTGLLQAIDVPLSKVLTATDIPADCKGKILFGGSSADKEAIITAANNGASGLITGSIDDDALKSYLGYDLGLALTGNEEIPMSVIITEGFGMLPMSEKVYVLLKKHSGQEASINGATQVRAGAIRPEIIVPHEKSPSITDRENMGLNVGQIVRLIRVPYFGLRGKVVEMPVTPEKIETGAETRVLKVELEGGKVVTVPRANVEL